MQPCAAGQKHTSGAVLCCGCSCGFGCERRTAGSEPLASGRLPPLEACIGGTCFAAGLGAGAPPVEPPVVCNAMRRWGL